MRKRKVKLKNKYIILFIIIFSFVFLLNLFTNLLLVPKIILKGKNVDIINYKSRYVEKGYSANYMSKNITDDVTVKGKVKTEKLGTYKITYSVKKGLFTKTVTRIVIVKDIEKPKLDIDNKDMYVCPGSVAKKQKVNAIDNLDGDISDKVNCIIRKDRVEYNVKDNAGNFTKVIKKIKYEDIEKPIIKLKGEEKVIVYENEDFKDEGYEVSDNCTKLENEDVKVSGTVDTKTIGSYKIKYTVKDKAKNEAVVEREVNVVKRAGPGTIYLTFDDGPLEGTTNIILDILKKHNVKATFFVTNKGPDTLIKREYDEGHTVALHTATHDYSYLYSSIDAYYEDLNSVSNRVKKITGIESKIIRFPGGGSNTISRKYSPGIMSFLTEDVLKKGYKYYDWNLSSGDAAGGTPTSEEIYNNVISNLSKDRINMVLMHDIKTFTRDALDRIITYGKENGYNFLPIDESTEMIRQRVNN